MAVFEESRAYRPFTYPWAAEAAQRHAINMHWDVNQVELQDDLRQYNSKDGMKTPNVAHDVNKHIVKSLLCLFTQMDATVGAGYRVILPHIRNNEIANMLMTFAAREVVHQRAYALAAETFGFTDSDWISFVDYAEMRDKIDVMTDDFFTEDMSLKLRVAIQLAQVFLGEGIGLFAAFASLLNLKRYGLLMGFNDINQWSLADEQEHVINNIRVLAEIRKELTEVENILLTEAIQRLVEEYVKAEHAFIDLVYEKGDQEGMTAQELKEYINYLGELQCFRMKLIGASEVRTNPLPWMEWMLSATKHDNFFEKRVTEYDHGGLVGEIDYSKYA